MKFLRKQSEWQPLNTVYVDSVGYARSLFPLSEFEVDENGTLHIYDEDSETDVFAPGQWYRAGVVQ